MAVFRTGDWARASALLSGAPARLRAGIAKALRQEAHALRNEIIRGITDQAPGGEPLKALASLTLAARELKGFSGTKALLRTGEMRKSISVIVQGEEAFIGIARSARTKDGGALVDVARIQEYGSQPIVIPVTPAMRRYLALLLRTAGESRRPGSGSAVVVTQVPARPFLRPAFERFRRGASERFLERVGREVLGAS